MWISKSHYDWLINTNLNRAVDAVRKEKDLLITKQQTENYMLYEKVGELNVQMRRVQQRLDVMHDRYYNLVEILAEEWDKDHA